MNPQPSEEQAMLKESVAKFCAAELPMEKLRAMAESEPSGLSAEVWGKIAAQGWLGVLAPESHGGLGLGVAEFCVILEEMGRALVPGPYLSAAGLAIPLLAAGGPDALKDEWLGRLASGEARATVALFGEDPSASPGNVDIRAKEKGEGWSLSGESWFVPDLAGADRVIVAARTGKKGKGGVSLFWIDPKAEGAEAENHPLTDVTSRSGRLRLKKVRVGPEDLIGEPGEGWELAESALRIASAGVAAASLGGAEKIFRTTLAYVRERTQFGQPIGSFQAVKHPLANLYADLENARSAYHYAAWAVDAKTGDAKAAAALARLVCTEAYRKTTLDCLQAHGGIGFTWEYDLHLYLKRAKHYQYLLGMPADFEETIAAEALGI